MIFLCEDVNRTRTQGAASSLTAEEALHRLLDGTGLTYQYIDDETVSVVPMSTTSEPTSSRGSPEPAEASTGGASNAARIELEEIVVTGTHIRGAQELPMPVMVFTREEIEKTGYSRVEDWMRSIPQNLASVTAAVGVGSSALANRNADRATGVDLRGLGPQSTLVLLNGQRRAGALAGRVVDISTIPLSIIERVEVVTGGRPAIYGSDAVAGVGFGFPATRRLTDCRP